MLVLSRKSGEGIRMTLDSGEVIQIAGQRMPDGKISFKIEAPDSVRIERDELTPQPRLKKPKTVAEFRQHRKAMAAA